MNSARNPNIFGGEIGGIGNQIADAVNQFGLAQNLRHRSGAAFIRHARHMQFFVAWANLQHRFFEQCPQGQARNDRILVSSAVSDARISGIYWLFYHQGHIVVQAGIKRRIVEQFAADKRDCAQRGSQLMGGSRGQTIKRRQALFALDNALAGARAADMRRPSRLTRHT